jgi:hypothetical protein
MSRDKVSDAAAFADKVGKARDKVHMANIYMQDGAIVTAARYLREGAEMLQEAADIRDLAMGLKPTQPADDGMSQVPAGQKLTLRQMADILKRAGVKKL